MVNYFIGEEFYSGEKLTLKTFIEISIAGAFTMLYAFAHIYSNRSKVINTIKEGILKTDKK